jgi:hypothetical protein
MCFFFPLFISFNVVRVFNYIYITQENLLCIDFDFIFTFCETKYIFFYLTRLSGL